MNSELAEVTKDSARGGFFLLSGTAASTVIMAIGSIIIARVLSSDAYGQYSLTLVVPQILLLFTELGINQGITKLSAELHAKGETDKIKKIIKHGLLLRAIAGVAIFTVNYAFADLFASVLLQRPELAFFIRIASTSILFQVILTTATSAFVGIGKTEYTALSSTIQATTKTIISIALVLLGFAITGAIIGHVISYVISSIVSIALLILILRKSSATQEPSPFTETTKILLKYGAPLYLSILLTGFIPLFNNVILAFFVSNAAIGNYKAAINFASLLTVLATPITTALLPAFSKLSSKNNAIKDFFKIANKYTAIAIMPAAILVITLSNQIVAIVYGSTYTTAAQYLAVYCLLYLLVGIGYLTLGSLYNGLGETKVNMKTSAITFTVLIITSPFTTSIYGVQGLIAAFLIASAAGQIYASWYARKNFQIKFDIPALIKIYIIAALSAVIPLLIISFTCLPLLVTVTLSSVIYALTYLTLMPLTRVMTANELQQTAQILHSVPLISWAIKPILRYQQKLLTIT